MTVTLDWPPVYTIKQHPRARHVKLKASIHHGLEVVVPPRFNQKNILKILEENKNWIQKQLEKIQKKLQQSPVDKLAEAIILSAVAQKWSVHYIKSDNKKLRLIARPTQELVLMGDIENKIACKKILSRWTKQQAKNHLISELKKLSEQLQLSFKKVVIRGQQTLWGSCSVDKAINLNYKLLFLPPHLARHVMIHELCHTIYLNHSAKFWRLVAKFDENWKEHTRELRRADQHMPMWLL